MANRQQRQEGTHDRPYSALNLRLVLASFGVITMLVLALVLLWFGRKWWAAVPAVIAVIAVINVIVVQRRRRQRHQRELEEGEGDVRHSLFE